MNVFLTKKLIKLIDHNLLLLIAEKFAKIDHASDLCLEQIRYKHNLNS